MQKVIYAFLIGAVLVLLFFTPYESDRDHRYFQEPTEDCYMDECAGWKYGRESEFASVLFPPIGMSIQVEGFLFMSAMAAIPVYYLFFREDEFKRLVDLKEKFGED